MEWKKGRGKLGVLQPLIGSWEANAESPMGPVHVLRTFVPVLGGKYVQMTVKWDYAQGGYEELALIGIGDSVDGPPKGASAPLSIWSFTSDGKHSTGTLADVTDIHPQAIGFESQMPAGLARQAYWPDDEEGFRWVVEARTKKGWNRFVEHLYKNV